MSFIQCQGLDSPPVIRLFHCAERSGWVEGREEDRRECVQDRGTRGEDRIHLLTIAGSLQDAFLTELLQILCKVLESLKQNTPPWLQMVGPVLFETTIITGQLQSSKPHLSWRLDYLCHQRAALSPDMGFTVAHSRALTRAHTHTHTLFPLQ